MATNEIELQVLKSVVTKLDQTLDKISESTNTIGKLLAAHDERLGYLEKNDSERYQNVKDLYSKMENITKDILKEMSQVETRIEEKLEKSSEQSSNQHSLLTEKVDQLDNRINEIEKWKWYVLGSIGVLLFLITNMDGLISISKLLTK
jgi:DNA anti-recombination protein RmuC